MNNKQKDVGYEVFWSKLNEKKKVTGDVILTKEQFKKMMKQAFDHGCKTGYDLGLASGKELNKMTRGADIFNGFFGGKK